MGEISFVVRGKRVQLRVCGSDLWAMQRRGGASIAVINHRG